MAGLDQILLQAGEVLVTESSSIAGVTETTSGYMFGEVVAVSDLIENAAVGQNVLFDIKKAVSTFKISVTRYWVINENIISLTEEAPL